MCVTAVALKKITLLLRFHSFGHDIQPKILSHPDDGPDDHGIIRIGGNVAHKTLIDLDLVQGQTFEIGQVKWTPLSRQFQREFKFFF